MLRTKRVLASLPAVALAVAGPLLAGCGSSTKVVSVTGPQAGVSASGTATATATSATATASAPATTSVPEGSGGTAASSGARTGRAPAYVNEESGSAELANAVATVKARGYTPNDTSQYHPNQTLRVLVGTRTGSGDGYNQQAFFFLDGRYLRTDSSAPSATLALVSQGDTEVTLGYPRYRPGDPLCCASGGQSQVTFALNNGRLAPLEPIPPISTRR